MINVYFPAEEKKNDSAIEDLIAHRNFFESLISSNQDALVIIGGDLNVNFAVVFALLRQLDLVYKDLIDEFVQTFVACDTQHDPYNVGYTYNFEMERFATMDHFILPAALSTSVVNMLNITEIIRLIIAPYCLF